MTDVLLLAHWLTTLFLLLIWCTEKCAVRWTGYRSIYQLYLLLPLIFCAAFALQLAVPHVDLPPFFVHLSDAGSGALPAVPARADNFILWVWCLGVALTSVPLVQQWRRLNQLRGEAFTLHGAQALVSSAVDGPCLKGVFTPVILLPQNFRDTFDAQQLQWIVAHEQVHARRRDNLWNMIALGLRTLFWFNPLLWLGYRHFRTIQELSCDEAVLAGEPRSNAIAYARTLLAASSHPTPITPQHSLCTHYGDKEMMMKRMQCIQSAREVSRTAQRLLLCAALTAGGVLSAVAAGTPSAEAPAPERIHTALPEYPETAMQTKVEADVILEFEIHPTEGYPMDIRVVKNTAPEDFRAEFDAATIRMLEQWRYRPTGKLQRNVRTLTRYRITDD